MPSRCSGLSWSAGMAEPAVRLGRVVFGDLAFRMHRIEPEAEIDLASRGPRRLDFAAEASRLAGAVEDHMVGQGQHLGHVARLVAGAIGRDLAAEMAAAEPRLPQARRRDSVEILRDEVAERPHREGLEREQNLDARAVADVGEDSQIRLDRSLVDDEGRRRHPAEVEAGERARSGRPRRHGRSAAAWGRQNASGSSSSWTCQGRPCLFSMSMNGSGSSCSMLNTPAPRQAPVSIKAAPIIAGTPVV